MGPHCDTGALVPVGRRAVRGSLLSFAIVFFLSLTLVDHVAEGLDSKHEVSVITGNSLDISCDVDVEKCSPVHSIKIFKDGTRVYTYVNFTNSSESTAHGDLVRSVGRIELVIYDDVALHIPAVFFVDEGLYRCETTYLQVDLDYCTTTAYTEVTILAPPSPPQITFSDLQFNETRIGPVMEGTDITLKCTSSGKPVPKVTWLNGTEDIGGAYDTNPETSETKIGLNTINLLISRFDLHSRFECQAINEAIKVARKTWIEVDVEVRPLTIDISEPEGPVNEGQEVTLECVVTGARPKADIAWFHGITEVRASQPQEEIVEENTFTVTTRSTYIFTATRADNGVKIRCRARNKVTIAKGEESLEDTYVIVVHYAPNVTVISEKANASRELEVKFSDQMEMFCKYDANPMKLLEVFWYRDGKLIDFNDTSDEDDVDHDYDDEERIYYKYGKFGDDDDDDDDDDDEDDSDDDDDNNGNNNDDNNLSDYPSLVINNILHVDKGSYTCRIKNEVDSVLSSTTLKVDVLYPPVMEINFDPEDIRDDEETNVTVECKLLTGNPHEAVLYRWWKDGIQINETEDDEIELISVDRDDTGNYTCAAKNKIGWGLPSKIKRLLVKYPPGEAKMSYFPETPVKGKKLTLMCGVDDFGEPPATRYRWYRNDIHLADAGKSEYVIESVSLKTISNFTCTAVNEVGEGIHASKYIEINAPPSFIEQLPEIYGVLENATDARLSCHVECFPSCSIRWYKDGNQITSKDPYSIKDSRLPNDFDTNHLASTLSTLIWNFTLWSNGRLNRDNDTDATYECVSTGTFVGLGVKSKAHFQVEYPPENITLSEYQIDVVFNTTPRSVMCNAFGVPEPRYWWTFGEEEVAAGPELSLKYGIPKEQGGIYTCTAFNKHGKQTRTTLLNVLYKPDCAIDKEITNDGYIVITCKVSANPTNVFFQWFKDDEPLTDDIYTEELESIVRFQEEESRYGHYACIANNSEGISELCSIEVTGEGGWLERLAENKAVFVTASVVAGVLLMLIVIIVVIVVFCIVKRRAAAKGVKKVHLEGRETPEGVQSNEAPGLRGTTGPSGGFPAKKGEPDNRAFYENLPFHGLQAPPNQSARPVPAPRNPRSPKKGKPIYQNMFYLPKFSQQNGDKPFKPILPDLEYADVDFPAQPMNNNHPYNKAKIVERVLKDVEDDEAGPGDIPVRPPRAKTSTRK